MSYNANPPEITLVRGDVNDTRVLEFTGVTDLAWATSATAYVWAAGGSKTPLTATITDAANRLVQVAFGAAGGWLSSVAAGSYLLEIKCTDGSQILTSPERREDLVQVIVRS